MGHRHYMLIEKDDWSVCLYSQWGAYYIEEVLHMVKRIIEENEKIKKINNYILSLKDNVEKQEIINLLLKINVNEVNEKTNKSFSLGEEDKQILDFYSLNDCLNQAENKKILRYRGKNGTKTFYVCS